MARKSESAKKRKWETNETELKPKRQRSQHADTQKRHGSVKAGRRTASEVDSKGDRLGKDAALETSSSEMNTMAENGLRIEDAEAGWGMSAPMGGRMMDIDPILTDDELYLILTFNTSIQVYSAQDSLLIRRIPIRTLGPTSPKGMKPARIIGTCRSPSRPDILWVACSNGTVHRVDWTQNQKETQGFVTVSDSARAISVTPATIAGEQDDVIFITESDGTDRLKINAYRFSSHSNADTKHILSIGTSGTGLQLLQAADDVIVGATDNCLFVGKAATLQLDSFNQLQYDLFSFECADLIASLDFRIEDQESSAGRPARKHGAPDAVNVVVGGARGAIYYYYDLFTRLQAAGKSHGGGLLVQAQKYHWHRRAVHAVKWSRDGNYMISGGSENTLVIWQMDTSRKDFLPHLSGSIENITISSNGSSYVVHIDDNSTMVISTAELKPTAYISGIQSTALSMSVPKDLLVRRTWDEQEPLRRPIPSAINPLHPSQLHLCVGSGQQAALAAGPPSAPFLQTFDLDTFTSSAKQAIARTQPTDVNLTSKGSPISEPSVTHVSFSVDGKWLASVDEWCPSVQELENMNSDVKEQLLHDRYEVYLKFWEVSGDGSLALVSRVNSPHASSSQETVLDIAAHPRTASFATVGSDGLLRLWQPKTRHQNGVSVKRPDGRAAFTWTCVQTVPVGDGVGKDAVVDFSGSPITSQPQGRLAFSEDGSTLFVAFGTVDTGTVHVIDTSSGDVVRTLEGMWSGELRCMEVLSPFVILASAEIRVYDTVSDELRYAIEVPKLPRTMDLLQLAVDSNSGCFAVALPLGDGSSIGIFDPEEPEPLLVRSTPYRVVTLKSASGQSGFVALDECAQVMVLAEASDPSSLNAMQPLEDLKFEIGTELVEEKDTKTLLLGNGVGGEEESEAEDNEDVEMGDDVDEDHIYPSVITQQQLSDIFDAAPAFAAPSIDDMFYKVTTLLATKPLASASS